MNIVWFKSDLRVADNPALSNAIKDGNTIAVFFLTRQQWQKHGISPAKQSLIIRQLSSVKSSLKALNVPLIIFDIASFAGVPKKMYELVQALGIRKVFWNKEHELNEGKLEKEVLQRCSEQGVVSHSYDDSCIIPAGRIVNKQNLPYKVFTAFKRAFVKEFYQECRPLVAVPEPQKRIDKTLLKPLSQLSKTLATEGLQVIHSQLEVEKYYSADVEKLWPEGEAYALRSLTSFFQNQASKYDAHRDYPSVKGTSQLSPYLSIGAITTRQCLQEALLHNNGELLGTDSGVNTWVNELIWREFYRHLIYWYPELCKFKPFKQETDKLQWSHDRDLFELWKQGKTGYPIVDAGMRELNKTGWMHNRVRMITAMFLTKHLFIDWRWGEAYFMSKLVDGDFASNNGGWQWSASTGVDAVPYFRIFNPVRQSERFDANGDYIRSHVPELRSLDSKSIHMPSAAQALDLGYVLPLVNHKEATSKTKTAFSNLNKNAIFPQTLQVVAQ